MKYTPLINQYAKFFFPRIERFNCGFKDPETNRPKSWYSSGYICDIFNGRGWDEERGKQLFLHDITRTYLTDHCDRIDTFYYRSNRSAPIATFMGDIDAHCDQLDAWAAWEWLTENHLPGVYAEPSTGGKGVHFYLHVQIGFVQRREANRRLKVLGTAIDRLLQRAKFLSNFCCFGGTYTIFTERNGERTIEKGDRGILGKLPRLPGGEEDLHALMGSKTYNWSELKAVVEAAKGLPDRPEKPVKRKVATTNRQHTDTKTISVSRRETGEEGQVESFTYPVEVWGDQTVDVLADRPPADPKPESHTASTTEPLKVISVSPRETDQNWRERPKLLDLYYRAKATSNPLARMRKASSLYRHIHGHYAADEDTLVDWYVELGLHTNEARGNERHERAKQALEKHRTTERRNAKGYDPQDWLPLVRRFVTQEVRASRLLKYRSPVEDELLAAYLYLLTLNAFKKNRPDRMHSCDDKAQVAFFQKLDLKKTVTRKNGTTRTTSICFRNKNKRLAAIDLLQLSGLIVLRDGNFVYGGKHGGVGNKYAPGVHHPRYAEFNAVYGYQIDRRSLPVLYPTRAAAA